MSAAYGEWAKGLDGRRAAKVVKDYLDEKILYWLGELTKRMDRGAVAKAGSGPAEKAISYIDAYQTMRNDLFGEESSDE